MRWWLTAEYSVVLWALLAVAAAVASGGGSFRPAAAQLPPVPATLLPAPPPPVSRSTPRPPQPSESPCGSTAAVCGLAEEWQCAWNVTAAVLAAATRADLPNGARRMLVDGARRGRGAAAARTVLLDFDKRGLTKDAVRKLRDIEAHATAAGVVQEGSAPPPGRSCGVVVRAADESPQSLQAASRQAEQLRSWLAGVPISLSIDSRRRGVVPSPERYDRALVLAPGVVPNPKVGRGPTLQGIAALLGFLRWHEVVGAPVVDWDYEVYHTAADEQLLHPAVLAMRGSECVDALRACWKARLEVSRCPSDVAGACALRDALRFTPARSASVSHKWRWESAEGRRKSACLDKDQRKEAVFIDEGARARR